MKTFVAHITVRPTFLLQVLDTTSGCPAGALSVTLYLQTAQNGCWETVDKGSTCDDGQLRLLKGHTLVCGGQYKLQLHTTDYFSTKEDKAIYPFVEILVQIPVDVKHLNISVHVGQHGYATYIGT